MSRFSYEVVATKYGKKLCIFWDDNYPDGIKDLNWEQTYRSMYNPKWDDADEKIVHEKVDETCWYIDHTKRAISLFENKFNVYVPDEYCPGESDDSSELEIVVLDGYSKFFIQSPPRKVDKLMDAELSYEEPNAQYTRSYKRGDWDGFVRIYNKSNHSAPLGLLQRAIDILEDEGFSVSVEWENTNTTADPIDTEWGDIELRDYQEHAVEAVLENDGGIIGLPTGTGKTITALNLIHLLRVERGRAIVLVHTKELLYQWADEIREHLGVEPGIVGDGKFSEGPVTVAIMQTLDSKGVSALEEDYGVVIFDECHRTSAAETFHEIGMALGCQYRVGLSATPWRRVEGEELYIEGAIGDVVASVTAEEMIDKGYLAKPIFSEIDPEQYGEQSTADDYEDYHTAYERCIETDPIRTLAIASRAAELADDGHKVLINVNRIAQGRLIASALNDAIDTDMVLSEVDNDKHQHVKHASETLGTVEHRGARMVSSNTDNREGLLDEFEDGDLDIMVSTLLKEGVNIPDISAVILAHGGKSDIEAIQTIGRALRPSNGDEAHIVDVRDRGKYFGQAYAARQGTMRDYYGKYCDVEASPDDDSDAESDVDLTEQMSQEEQDELMDDML